LIDGKTLNTEYEWLYANRTFPHYAIGTSQFLDFFIIGNKMNKIKKET